MSINDDDYQRLPWQEQRTRQEWMDIAMLTTVGTGLFLLCVAAWVLNVGGAA